MYQINFNVILKDVSTRDLWAEIGRRLNVTYGKIQMAFHKGKPSDYVQLDISVPTEGQTD